MQSDNDKTNDQPVEPPAEPVRILAAEEKHRKRINQRTFQALKDAVFHYNTEYGNKTISHIYIKYKYKEPKDDGRSDIVRVLSKMPYEMVLDFRTETEIEEVKPEIKEENDGRDNESNDAEGSTSGIVQTADPGVQGSLGEARHTGSSDNDNAHECQAGSSEAEQDGCS